MKYMVPSIGMAAILVYMICHYTFTINNIPLFIIFFIGFNLFEYLIHRYAMHKRTWILPFIYDSHARHHHVIFTETKMQYQSLSQIKEIVMPLKTLCLLSLLLTSISLLVHLVSPSSSIVFTISALFYVISYEWIHLLYHTPIIGQSKIIKKISILHTIHHRTKTMRYGNFNVTIPLFDLLFRTLVRK